MRVVSDSIRGSGKDFLFAFFFSCCCSKRIIFIYLQFFSAMLIHVVYYVSLSPYHHMFKWLVSKSFTISLLINVEFCSIEELNVLSYFFLQYFYPCLSVKFVTNGHTVGRKWLTGCGDFASWIIFIEVSIRIISGLVLVAMITTFR